MLQVNSFVFNPFSENTYVIYDETKECVIVDPGCASPSEEDRLFGFIDSHQLKPLMVINTHGHVDHVVGNNAVKRRYGIKVAAHPDTHPDFTQAKRQAVWLGFQPVGAIDLPDVDLEDDEVIQVGNCTLEVICTPGHARGSVSLYAPVDGWVLRVMHSSAVVLFVPTFLAVTLKRFVTPFEPVCFLCLTTPKCIQVIANPPRLGKRRILTPTLRFNRRCKRERSLPRAKRSGNNP